MEDEYWYKDMVPPLQDNQDIKSIEQISTWNKDNLLWKKFPQLLSINRLNTTDDLVDLDISSISTEPLYEADDEVNKKISLWFGDITTLDVDFICNSAHSELCGGGGVDGHIHKQAGLNLLRACELLGGCDPGDAKMTEGFDLPAKHILHAVGPTSYHETSGDLLQSVYQRCLEIFKENGYGTIAFPCIATGTFDFPIIESCEIVLRTIREWLSIPEHLENTNRIIFDVFRIRDEAVYQALMLAYFP